MQGLSWEGAEFYAEVSKRVTIIPQMGLERNPILLMNGKKRTD